MASKKIKIKKASQIELMQTIRKDWGTLNPIQRVKASKKVYKRKAKHQKVW
jgi:hypothetical protein